MQIVSYIEALSADEDGILAGISAENPNVEIGPDDIGTLSFTSGSTGIPKGTAGPYIGDLMGTCRPALALI